VYACHISCLTFAFCELSFQPRTPPQRLFNTDVCNDSRGGVPLKISHKLAIVVIDRSQRIAINNNISIKIVGTKNGKRGEALWLLAMPFPFNMVPVYVAGIVVDYSGN